MNLLKMTDNQFVEHLQERMKEYVSPLDTIVDKVISQIENDLELGDKTAIADLLQFVPQNNLVSYLPEAEQVVELLDTQQSGMFSVKSWICYKKDKDGSVEYHHEHLEMFTKYSTAFKDFETECSKLEQRQFTYKKQRRYAKVQLCRAIIYKDGRINQTGEVLLEKDYCE